MKFRPLHDRVLVERVESANKTAGGIILPDTAQEKHSEGKIVAVGSGARNEKGEQLLQKKQLQPRKKPRLKRKPLNLRKRNSL